MQETAAHLEAEQSQDDLLQRVKEMEGEVESAKEQVRKGFGKSGCRSVIVFLLNFLEVTPVTISR